MGSNHEKKTGGRKSRDILPLKGQCHCTTVQHNPVQNVLYEPAGADYEAAVSLLCFLDNVYSLTLYRMYCMNLLVL